MLTNTTYEIQHDKTNEKKTVHRNHIVPYYPKEEKIQELVENYVVPTTLMIIILNIISIISPNLTLIAARNTLLFCSGL